MEVYKSFKLAKNDLGSLCLYLEDLNKKHPHIFFLLDGDLASGKTTLVKTFVKAKTGKDIVTSPTYNISQDYDGQIFHYDFYQRDFTHLLEGDFLELFERVGIHFIEWGSAHLKEFLKKCNFVAFTIEINALDSAQREYIVSYE